MKKNFFFFLVHFGSFFFSIFFFNVTSYRRTDVNKFTNKQGGEDIYIYNENETNKVMTSC